MYLQACMPVHPASFVDNFSVAPSSAFPQHPEGAELKQSKEGAQGQRGKPLATEIWALVVLGLENGGKSSLYDLNTTGGEKTNAGWRAPGCI